MSNLVNDIAGAAKTAVTNIASDIGSVAKQAAGDSVKQAAQTPLDILEQLLGQSPAKSNSQKSKEEGGAASVDPAAMQQRATDDVNYQAQKQQQLHTQILQQSESYYQQKKQMEAQQRQAQLQQEQQKKFEIKQLEKHKKNDLALKMAQDASSAEKRVGAG